MIKTFLLSLFLFSAANSLVAQQFDSLKLSQTEIPEGYLESSKREYKTPHAVSFYEQVELYESFVGKLKKKDIQSFNKKGDKGTIFYFEFESDFEGAAFLDGLLWGQEGKATTKKPEEYFAKGKFLVIWSFDLKSELKEISRRKVTSVLK
ncbi:hypothetical protein WG954_07335 [Lacibacter sp. H375]|uniref:hypothetical protein n=1 Tax=Lacibacter sp. H375 TaxID=3133424 RepID=UPI0030BB2B18